MFTGDPQYLGHHSDCTRPLQYCNVKPTLSRQQLCSVGCFHLSVLSLVGWLAWANATSSKILPGVLNGTFSFQKASKYKLCAHTAVKLCGLSNEVWQRKFLLMIAEMLILSWSNAQQTRLAPRNPSLVYFAIAIHTFSPVVATQLVTGIQNGGNQHYFNF